MKGTPKSHIIKSIKVKFLGKIGPNELHEVSTKLHNEDIFVSFNVLQTWKVQPRIKDSKLCMVLQVIFMSRGLVTFVIASRYIDFPESENFTCVTRYPLVSFEVIIN